MDLGYGYMDLRLEVRDVGLSILGSTHKFSNALKRRKFDNVALQELRWNRFTVRTFRDAYTGNTHELGVAFIVMAKMHKHAIGWRPKQPDVAAVYA